MVRDGAQQPQVGALVRAWRRAARLTQEELAARSELGVRTIRDLELGRVRRPHPRSVRLLAEALGLDEADQARLEAAVRAEPWAAADRAGGAGAGQRAPAQLPADVPAFTGRTAELSALDGLSTAAGGAAPVVISAVSGTAGVGKTALAVRWAHHAAARFPDGQLYVNLRGYDPDRPVAAADALAGFLGALGVAGPDVPAELAERAARYRTELAGRRILVVLDNAASAEQVRPLLPGTPSAFVVVTSRESLAGLVVLHGAHRIDLDLLPSADAIALLRTLIGARAEAEPEAAAVLAEQCARLPLALRVAAELARTRAGVPLATLVAELADRQHRLAELRAGDDPRAAVQTVFSWSYQDLPAEAARAFRLLGLHPGPDFDAYATAALTGADLAGAERLLDLLAGAHLLQPTDAGRYAMHDLLRAYACQLTAAGNGQPGRAALTRLFDYYLATAAAAMDVLHPAGRPTRPRVPDSPAPVPPFPDQSAALHWLDAERAVLTVVAAHTAEHGWPAHTTRLAVTLFRYLDIGGHYPDALAIHGHAGRAARLTGDAAAEGHALVSLAAVHRAQARHGRSQENLEQALALFRTAGDVTGQARVSNSLGTICWEQGRFAEAGERFDRALALYQEAGNQAEEAVTTANLGLVYERLGHHRTAAARFEQALALSRATGELSTQAHALSNLGAVRWAEGNHELAIDHLEQALRLYERSGHRAGQAHGLSDLGDAYRHTGRLPAAAEHLRRSLALFRELGHHSDEAKPLNGLGETALAAGHPDQARADHIAALAAATRHGDRYQEARAYTGLGDIHAAAGDPAAARQLWQRALEIYTDLTVPEAADLRTRLGLSNGT